ncbi:D-lactate dehydrogenase [Rhizobium sp. R693]|uniref:D-lactate dehydrogenase n=1 Tax=Rhizobium sp. R693 TaxID=1764276 RepID=UPI001FDA5640|nr:D-lactate dehydrogenase [Rhizobium sp. R693]
MELSDQLRTVVGEKFVVTRPIKMRRFIKGFRFGDGKAHAVALPGSLVELWLVLKHCIAAGATVIAQAANTGLTGGSTPFGAAGERKLVVINTMRIKGLQLLGDGRQVVAFPGATLDELEKTLRPIDREPHSVIGSSCLGASVVGGICNNSGGSLIQRGPAYTELALFAQVDDEGRLSLINHLGIDLGNTPEEILRRLDNKDYESVHIDWSENKVASDREYHSHVRQIDEPTPARFNMDPRRLHEASGSAGKVIVFAVRLDTFEVTKNTKVFYIGTNDPGELTRIRREILGAFKELPISAEYIHRDAFDIAEKYGKDTYLLVKWLGTGRIPRLFDIKSRLDACAERIRFLPANTTDRLLQLFSRILPPHLPVRLRDFRQRFEHHLMIKVAGEAVQETAELLSSLYPSEEGAYFECNAKEGAAAFLHRFATAGAAVRYRAVNGRSTGGIVALDIALPRNENDWVERLPPELEAQIVHKLYYGHFFCHVFHQDYLVRPSVDWLEMEHKILELLDDRSARYPAEHNVGHLYKADEVLQSHYRNLDPCNCFNPGIGQTSMRLHWG